MKKISFLVSIISILLCFQNCNKVKNKTKDKMHIPDYSYKDNNIDQFYYTSKTIGSNQIIPLIKPYNISNIGSPSEWFLDTDFGFFLNELGGGISPISRFNCTENYIFGYKPFDKYEKDSSFDIPEKWFIINTQEKKLTFFEKETEFKTELKKLNLPVEMLSPDAVYEQYKTNPVLPWFPENIKKQLEEVKKQKN